MTAYVAIPKDQDRHIAVFVPPFGSIPARSPMPTSAEDVGLHQHRAVRAVVVHLVMHQSRFAARSVQHEVLDELVGAAWRGKGLVW